MGKADPASKDRLRITGTVKRFDGFREFKKLNIKRLRRNTRLEILKGNIRWIFILDHPKSASAADENVASKKLDLSRTPSSKKPTWGTDYSHESSSTDTSGRSQPVRPLIVPERSAAIPEARTEEGI